MSDINVTINMLNAAPNSLSEP